MDCDLDPWMWAYTTLYLRFPEKMNVRAICKDSRRRLDITSIPKGIKLSDKIILSIKGLTKLQTLDASGNPNITDASIVKLTNLQTLDARYNPKITDASVVKLTNLQKLYASGNPNITIKIR